MFKSTKHLLPQCYPKLYVILQADLQNVFFSNDHTLCGTTSVVLDFATELLFSEISKQPTEREIIAIVNTFRFNSTCLLVNSVIHLWIGRLFNDNSINVNNVRPFLFPLIYHLGMWPRSTCNTKDGGVGWQTKFEGVESSVRFCQRSSLIDHYSLMKEWALGSVGY